MRNWAKFGCFRPSFLLRNTFGEREMTDEKEETCAKRKIAFAEQAI